MTKLGGVILASVSLGACSKGFQEAKLRQEVEAAYWHVSDGCSYSTDEAVMGPMIKGKRRYHRLKVQAAGQPHAKIYKAVEVQVDELLSRRDIDCPRPDSPEALKKLQETSRDLDKRLVAIEQLLQERVS